jgi:hypothetical protein
MAAAARFAAAPGERRDSVTRGRCSPAVPTMARDQVAADPLAQPGVAFLGRAAVHETPVTASRPPPRPRRGSQTPARNAPWAASERVNVSAAHARRGRGSEARRRRGDAAALGLGSTRRLRRGRDDRMSSAAGASRTGSRALALGRNRALAARRCVRAVPVAAGRTRALLLAARGWVAIRCSTPTFACASREGGPDRFRPGDDRRSASQVLTRTSCRSMCRWCATPQWAARTRWPVRR